MTRTQNIIIRYIILFTGLLIMAFGIAVVAKSNSGTTPISSVPFVLSLIFPITFGQFTCLLSILFMIAEFVILGRDFPKAQLWQIIIGPFFGFFTDLGMYIFSPLNPSAYWARMLALLIGSILMALGIYLQVAANVIMNPGEGAVKALAYKFKIRFGNVKIVFDAVLGITALLISVVYFGDIRGIREGTIVSIFLVGFLVKIWSRIANYFDFEKKLYPIKMKQ